ncbi:MAG: CBS domain-containing protein [Chloroflexi bacterium]|nr:CBS domain-containing protein [Chloroflexota bacterium]
MSQTSELQASKVASPSLAGRLARLAQFASSWLDRHQPPEDLVLITTAMLVGLGTAMGAVIFIRMIAFFQSLFFESLPHAISALGPYWLILIPMIGGLLAGPIIAFFAPEAKGHGVPEVMMAIALYGGRIRPRVVAAKALASSVCIGSGGSAGREGPIVQIGAALGSTLGQLFRLSDERIRNLVACGAAAGIAATFNAPIAGVLFSVEVILGEVSLGPFANVVVSAVAASVLSRAFLGEVAAFQVPRYGLNSPWELILYTLLGILAAAIGILFIKMLYGFEEAFDEWRFPEWAKPAVGGLLLGILGFIYPRLLALGLVPRQEAFVGLENIPFFPHVFGAGFPIIEGALDGRWSLTLLIVLIFLKVLATSLTLGSGNSGGVFAPALFMGAMLGGGFGLVAEQLVPQWVAGSGAYAVVGMAAVFAGAARAPLTAILIVFEMTNDYRLILPLMFSTGISTLLAEHWHRESIYTLKLVRRGIHWVRGRDIDIMQGITVAEVMTTNPDTVSADMTISELAEAFARTHHHGFPVLDEEGKLYGVVTLQDLERATARAVQDDLRVRDICTTDVVVAYPDEPVWVVLKRMGVRDIGRLPVVDRDDPRRLLGMVRRSDIVRAYNIAITRRLELQHRMDRLRLGKVTGTEFVEAEVTPESLAAGRQIRELPLPHDCVIVSVRRGRGLIIPHGDTVLQPGDQVTALVDLKCIDEFKSVISSDGTGHKPCEDH